MVFAQWVVNLAMVYAALGVAFAIAFVFYGVDRIDSAAKHARLMFRLLIFPGVAALWPLLLTRWLSGRTQPPVEQNAHRNSAVKEVKQ
jgi:hypothetical protein